MFDSNKYSVNPNELDHLLNRAFLELDFSKPENETIMNAVSQQVMFNDNYAPAKTKTKLNFKISVFIATAVVIIGAGFLVFKTKNAESLKTESDLPLAVNEINSFSKNETAETETEIARNNNLIPDEPLHNNEINKTPVNVPLNLIGETKDSIKKDESVFTMEPVFIGGPVLKTQMVQDSAYVFPKLTEKEIRVNTKQKRRMLESLMKFNKDKYALIPMGTFNYKHGTVSLYPFYMQTMEVTNSEYRTFLFDLLIQNRKEEFLKAKPDQQQWMKEFNRAYFQPMADNYFSRPAYNNHPVVNITREGAQLYCIWLTEEVNKVLSEKGKAPINDVRLPHDDEWTYAALAGLNGPYPWGTDFIRVRGNGCFYANFCLKKYKGKMDSIFFTCNKKAFINAYTTGGLMLGEGTYPVMVGAYNPNDYYLYCMSGNVAEMVEVWNNKTNKKVSSGTKGGSWDSSPENIKIYGEDEYAGKTGASPFIGFRPVISVNRAK